MVLDSPKTTFTDMLRGTIVHRARARQIRDFSGLCFGRITPTDIDGLIEYRGRGYVLLELKHIAAAPIPYGQRLALQRLTDDLQAGGKRTVCIIAEHDIGNASTDINVAAATVKEYRLDGEWRPPKEHYNVRDFITLILERYMSGDA